MKYVTDLNGNYLTDSDGNYVVVMVADDPTISSREIPLGAYRSRYAITLHQPDGTLIADISGLCLKRQFQVRRNRAEQVNLTLHLAAAQDLANRLGSSFDQLFSPGMTEVRVTRGNRTLIGGQLLYCYPRLEPNSRTLELKVAGFLDLFSTRWLLPTMPGTNSKGETVYVATDLGAVAWDVIDKTQDLTDGNFGVTQGIIQTSRAIGETFQPFASSIKEILIGLTERINGIDFAFTPTKQFQVYYPGIGTEKTELLFSYPGNIVSLGLPRDATSLVNVSINRGSGNGLDQQPIPTRTDASSTAVYKRRERIDDSSSISVVDTLNEKGDETLRLYANPVAVPEVVLDGNKEPFLGAYWVGDRVRFHVAEPAFAALDNQTWRINEIAADIDALDHEAITLKVGYA